MKYRLMNPDGSPTELVYDDLFRATYMVNMLSHWTQTHLGIQAEEGDKKENVTYLPGNGKKDESYWEQTREDHQ